MDFFLLCAEQVFFHKSLQCNLFVALSHDFIKILALAVDHGLLGIFQFELLGKKLNEKGIWG